MYNNHPTVNSWIGRHLDKDRKNPFSEIDVKKKVTGDMDPSIRASVNLESKKLTLYIDSISRLARTIGVSDEVMIYYVLSHELGHLIYQETNKAVDEEYFAHSYGAHDTLNYYTSSYRLSDKLMNMNYR